MYSLFSVKTRHVWCALALSWITTSAASDIVNTATVSYDGPNDLVTLPTNTVRTAASDPVPPGGALFVQKGASRQVVEIGDYVDFTVAVKNVGEYDLAQVVVDDRLPFGFAYQGGSSRRDNAKIPDPQGGAGPNLVFALGNISAGRTATLTYRARVGVDALHGDGINRAKARTIAAVPAISNTATVRVEIEPGVLTNQSVIIGKIFLDRNHNRIQDNGEPGVPGVRLYIEDGSYAVTDEEGKYSFYGISLHSHVVKVDRTTLPPGAELEPLNNRHAKDGGSILVELRGAEMYKANFAIGNATPAMIDHIRELRGAAESLAAGEVNSGLKARFDRNGSQQLAADPRSLPASGVLTPGVAVQPTTQDRTQSADSVILGGLSLPPANASPNLRGFASIAVSPSPAPSLRDISNPLVSTGPSATLEQSVQQAGNAERFGFLDLKDHDTLPVAQTTIRVKNVAGAKVALRVNGRQVPESRIGKRIALAAEGIEATEFIGVELQPGPNKLELSQTDQFGNDRGQKAIVVIAPDKLGAIRIKTPDDAIADGKTPARIVIELVDNNGTRVTARTSLTLEASMSKWLTNDLNPRDPGVQVFLEGGHGEYLLASPLEPGDARIRVSSGIMQAQAQVSFLPELRPLIAAGVIEGKINISHLNAGAIRPIGSRDTFDAELRDFAVHGNNTSAAGRVAFFLKGKILGNYLLTAAYDSERNTRERLFRDIQPDQFYPVYGDASVKGFEAQSTGQLYVRIDNKKSYLLYGDFVTNAPNDIRQLGNYNRSLNGIREHYENKFVSANAWASYDTGRQVVEELRGNGTSGPYSFRTANGLVNSEKVEILTRDRNNPGLVINIVPMTRFTDYEFEPLTGQLLFKAPIPSLDADLNPISIRVTYEIDQGGDKFWVYGADAQVKIGNRVEVGGAFARDDNPTDRYALYSGNAVFDLGRKTFLFGEFAHSMDEIEGNGSAERVELRHNSDKLFARIYWGRADSSFKNQTAILTAGRTEGGAQISYQFAKNSRAIVQGVDTQSRTGGDLRGVLVGVEQTFGKNIRLEIDGRYSDETGGPATPAAALTPVTKNEVRSARAKLTLPIPWSEGGGLMYGEYEQDLFEDKRLAAIGGEYRLDAKTRIYIRHELISSLGGPFELNTVQRQNTTVWGVESAYAKDATYFNEYRARNGFSGREAEAAIGLRNIWPLADGLRASTTFERVSPIEGVNDTKESTAVTGAIEYTANPDWKATARLELRTSSTVDSLLNSLGFASKLTDDWTFLGRSVVYVADNKGPSAINQTQARVQAGFAWRQTSQDIWNALGKYEFRTEDGAPGTFDTGVTTPVGSRVQRRVNILSLDVNYQPSANWEIRGHYAGKLAFEDSNGRNDMSGAHLLTTHITHDLTSRLDVGLGVNALIDGNGRSVQFGVGPEIGFTVADNLRAAIGYNFNGFSDQDLTAEEYTSHGVYLALRLKFDEALFRWRKEETK